MSANDDNERARIERKKNPVAKAIPKEEFLRSLMVSFQAYCSDVKWRHESGDVKMAALRNRSDVKIRNATSKSASC